MKRLHWKSVHREIDILIDLNNADIRLRQTRRFRVSIDRDHSNPEVAHVLDRSALVPAGADEENGSLHCAAMLQASVRLNPWL